MPTNLDQVLERTLAVLPVTREDLLVRGIAAQVTERIVELRKAGMRLQSIYGSRDELERQVKQVGVSPDDHTAYTDLIEWRAIDTEMRDLFSILGTM